MFSLCAEITRFQCDGRNSMRMASSAERTLAAIVTITPRTKNPDHIDPAQLEQIAGILVVAALKRRARKAQSIAREHDYPARSPAAAPDHAG